MFLNNRWNFSAAAPQPDSSRRSHTPGRRWMDRGWGLVALVVLAALLIPLPNPLRSSHHGAAVEPHPAPSRQPRQQPSPATPPPAQGSSLRPPVFRRGKVTQGRCGDNGYLKRFSSERTVFSFFFCFCSDGGGGGRKKSLLGYVECVDSGV